MSGTGPLVRQRTESMNLAFVLLSKPALPSGREIVRAFSHFAQDSHQVGLPRGGAATTDTEVIELEVSPGGTVFVALLAAPVPNGEADDATRFSMSAMGTNWKPPPHAAHLLVTLSGLESESKQTVMLCFTSLVAAVCKASGAVGVYFGDAGATHDPEFFMAVAREPELVSLLMLWTGVSVARESDGRLSMLSLGMQQLDLPDLLLVAPRSTPGTEALATFFDLLAYVVRREEAIPDGDTVGRSAEERLSVHYVSSPRDNTKQVWRVELA